MTGMSRVGAKIAGLLLAAGASTRMGRPKQLLHVQGVTLLERILNEALKSELDKIILILGNQSKEIKKVLGQVIVHKKLRVIENPRYRQGISSSITAGLSEVEVNYDHVMILLADLPHVTSRLINLLIHRYLESRLPIGAIQVKSKRSHPVIFGRPLYNELRKLQGDMGARALFQKYGDRACLVEPDFFYDDMDIDTEEDYAEFQRSLKNQQF
jgi:molybdenum cofactor cytidylyltransferase